MFPAPVTTSHQVRLSGSQRKGDGVGNDDEDDVSRSGEAAAPLSPREAMGRYRARNAPSPEWKIVEELLADEKDWLRTMVMRVADSHNVDADELLQNLLLSLRGHPSFDMSRTGSRSWLTRRAAWRAKGMRREISGRWHSADALDDLERRIMGQHRRTPARPFLAGGTSSEPLIGTDWDMKRLDAMGIRSPSLAQAVLLVMWNLDYRDFDELADIGDQVIRQRKSRGLAAVRDLIGLMEVESTVLRAMHRHGSVLAVADELQMTAAAVSETLLRALSRIRRFLDGGESESDVD